jgi:hypothetical protein
LSPTQPPLAPHQRHLYFQPLQSPCCLTLPPPNHPHIHQPPICKRMDPKTPTTYRGLPPSLRTPSFGSPASPHRYSPGSSLHGQHEDPLIFEIGSRLLRAGFTNEATPRCQLAWSNALWRRVGGRVSSNSPAVGKRKGGRSVWDLGFALRGAEEGFRAQLGLVEDLVERGLRVAYNK